MGRAPTLPNLLVVGAAKAGTTSLHSFLASHPQAFMSAVKEPRYFAYEGERPDSFGGPSATTLIDSIVTSRHDYERLFDQAGDARVVGESSPAYLYSTTAAARIHATIPGAQIVAVLRDPAERAYSHWVDNVGSGWEPVLDFDRALDLAEQRERDNWWRKWDYIGHGFYAEQLTRYLALFPHARVKVLFFDDLVRDPVSVFHELLLFLGLDPAFASDGNVLRRNVGGVPRSRLLSAALSRPHPLRRLARSALPPQARARLRGEISRRNTHKPPLSVATRRRLQGIYRADILALQEMLGRDLAAWLG